MFRAGSTKLPPAYKVKGGDLEETHSLILYKETPLGNSLVAQCLGLSLPRARVQSLVGEIRSHKL